MTSYPAFGDWGRMIFPVDTGYYSGSTLGSLRLTWYSNIQPAKTVEIVNYMREKADAGEQIFYRIYTDRRLPPIPGRLTPGCSSSRVIPAQSSPSATRAADSHTSGQCTTAFPTPWS